MNIEFISFVTLSLFIAITPGPSVIYVVSYSLRFGAKAGIVSTLGINAGSVIAILISAFGLSALLTVYPNAITVIEVIGGFYVLYLATLIWPRKPAGKVGEHVLAQASYFELFKNGVITSVLNPKDILFYTAFIPTFIPKNIVGDQYQAYFLYLAFTYMAIGFFTKSTFSLFAGFTRKALHSENANIVNYLSSGLLFGLGGYLIGKSLALLPK